MLKKQRTMSGERSLSIKREVVRTNTNSQELFEKRVLNLFDVQGNSGKTLKSKYDNVPKVIDSLDLLPNIDTFDFSDTKTEDIFKQTKNETKGSFSRNQTEFSTFHNNVLRNSNWGKKNYMHHETTLDRERLPIQKAKGKFR